MSHQTAARKVAMLVACTLAGLAVTAQAAVYTYEMEVAPDKEPVHPMTDTGFGFGDPLDVPPYGLQGDGTARFVDESPVTGGGFIVTGLAGGAANVFTVDMRIRVNRNTFTPYGSNAFARSMSICNANDSGRGIRLRKDSIAFHDSGVFGVGAVDLSDFHMIRMVMSGSGIYVYDLETPGGPPWNLITSTTNIGATGPYDGDTPNIKDGTGGLSLNTHSGGAVTLSDFTLDWLRVDTGVDRGASGAIIAGPTPPACRIVAAPNYSNVPPDSFFDVFAYPDGNLNGQGGWSGTATTQIAVAGGEVKSTGSTGVGTSYSSVHAINTVADANGLITVTFNFRSGQTGTGAKPNYAHFRVYDAAGKVMAWWTAAETYIYARGPVSLPSHSLTDTSVHTLKAVIDVVNERTYYYFDGQPDGGLGYIAYAGIADRPANITIARLQYDAPNCTVYYDNISVEGVTATTPVKASVVQGQPGSIDFNLRNLGTDGFTYSSSDVPNESWLTFTNGSGSLASGANTTVTAQVANTAPAGIHKLDLVFATNCGDNVTVPVELTVEDCLWEVRPTAIKRYPGEADQGPTAMILPWCDAPAQYTIEVVNTGAEPFNYHIAMSGDCTSGWLQTDGLHPLGSSLGPVAPGTTDTVTIAWDPTGLNESNRNCQLTFTNENTHCEKAVMPREIVVDEARWLRPLEGATDNMNIFIHYQGDAAPDIAHSAGVDLNFRLMTGGAKVGAVVDDAQAIDGKAWQVSTTGGAGREYWIAQSMIREYSGLGGSALQFPGSTLVMRVKTVSMGADSGSLLATNDKSTYARHASLGLHMDFSAGAGGGDGVLVEQGHDFLDAADRTANLSGRGAGDGEYHIVRVASGLGRYGYTPQVVVWLDEDPTPVLSFEGLGFAWESEPGWFDTWFFGMQNANTGTDMYIDYLTGTTAGMFAPGEELCKGIDLAPAAAPTGACCDPVAGACTQTTMAACTASGGTWYGYGIACNNPIVASCSGACCVRDEASGYCVDNLDRPTCEAAPHRGVWQGPGTDCATAGCTLCSGLNPFADIDGDADVDQEDFALLQQCYSGSGVAHPTADAFCSCLDRGADIPGDGDIDNYDVSAFENCTSGPGIPADACCDGGDGCP